MEHVYRKAPQIDGLYGHVNAFAYGDDRKHRKRLCPCGSGKMAKKCCERLKGQGGSVTK